MACPRNVSVKASYRIHGKETESKMFDGTNTPIVRIGLPPGMSPVKPQPGDYSYSGLHDAGSLPLPREQGPMAQLIACVQQAKTTNDEYLTRVIQQENQDKSHPSKKAKTETT